MTALGVFLASALAGVVWCWYIQSVAEKRRWRAAALDALLVLMGAFATVSFVDDRRLMLVAAAGAFVGTLASVRRGSH
jgi:hypothetical protein